MAKQDETKLVQVTEDELRLLRKVAEKASDVLLGLSNGNFAALHGGTNALIDELHAADQKLMEFLGHGD